MEKWPFIERSLLSLETPFVCDSYVPGQAVEVR